MNIKIKFYYYDHETIPSFVTHHGNAVGDVTNGTALSGLHSPSDGTLPDTRISSPILNLA